MRKGLTLIELLVVVAIIFVLIALFVPAIQKVRASAARAQCATHLQQIGLAVQQYYDQFKVLPSGMRLQKFKDPYPLSAWLTHILPYVEQHEVYRIAQSDYTKSRLPFQPPHKGLSTVIPIFLCPADSRIRSSRLAPRDKIQVAFTSYVGVSGKDLTTRDGIFFCDSRVTMNQIADGASNTLMAGERPPSADFQFGWWYAGVGQRYTGSGDMLMGVFEQNVRPVTVGSCAPGSYPYSPGSLSNQCDMFHFWSLHPGGAHFLFADATVRFLDYSAAPIMPALASRAGGEAVTLP